MTFSPIKLIGYLFLLRKKVGCHDVRCDIIGVKRMHQCLKIKMFDEKIWDGMTKVLSHFLECVLTFMFILVAFSSIITGCIVTS